MTPADANHHHSTTPNTSNTLYLPLFFGRIRRYLSSVLDKRTAEADADGVSCRAITSAGAAKLPK